MQGGDAKCDGESPQRLPIKGNLSGLSDARDSSAGNQLLSSVDPSALNVRKSLPNFNVIPDLCSVYVCSSSVIFDFAIENRMFKVPFANIRDRPIVLKFLELWVLCFGLA